ncbi:hypothetical protein JL720_3042 [Aureococcus anophagefferens]|nr:hypothetical protein JL720_3042 [Aureococcus anophagefferens]
MSPAASGTTSTATTRAFEEAAAARLVVPEADWDLKGAEDARQLLYEREVAWKYGALTARAINAYWRVDTLLRGQAQAGSPLAAVPTCLLAAVAAWAEGSGADAVAAEAARRRDAFQAPRARACGSSRASARPTTRAGPRSSSARRRPASSCTTRGSRSNRTLRVRHHYFETDGVFAGAAPVVAAVVDPLLDRFLVRKRDAALLLFGQTGTGKTHTLREALDRLVDRHAGPVEVRFLELSGKKDCRDLLNDGAPVKLLSDADEKIHFAGATVRAATTAAELRGALEAGLRLRASEETERNAASSRSHAVVQVLAPDGRALTLVDLAGSERKWETMGMRSRAQNRESADINLSLMALKDCFRATHDGGRVPYRSSSLTRVLRTRFFDAEAVHLVATLSPSADDLIHSVYSVATACLMAPGLGDATRSTVATERLAAELSAGTGDPALEHPARWSADTTRAWLLTAERGKFNRRAARGDHRGDLLSVDAAGLGALFAGRAAPRDGHEGAMWVVGADTDAALAREITNALKREACKWRLE